MELTDSGLISSYACLKLVGIRPTHLFTPFIVKRPDPCKPYWDLLKTAPGTLCSLEPCIGDSKLRRFGFFSNGHGCTMGPTIQNCGINMLPIVDNGLKFSTAAFSIRTLILINKQETLNKGKVKYNRRMVTTNNNPIPPLPALFVPHHSSAPPPPRLKTAPRLQRLPELVRRMQCLH